MSTNPPYHSLVFYTGGTPNGFKPSVMLEELNLQYKVEMIDLDRNEQKQPDFLVINPNGKIPALKDGDMRVFESGAIMLYITDQYDTENQISYKQGEARHFRATASVYSTYGIDRYIGETRRLYSVLESRLGKADWLAGDKYTIADIACFTWVRSLERWFKRIRSRPAVHRGYQVPPSRTPEEMRDTFMAMRAKVDAMKNMDKR